MPLSSLLFNIFWKRKEYFKKIKNSAKTENRIVSGEKRSLVCKSWYD
ncbi:hypothetical protein SERIO_v1c04780 [Spiroplasma eriocheiris]|uniref:Uncharacterized protein n=1 Tax=Spiroplasma eriocheiris TaxID=315358 RepID=A0A0H3XMC8_9MOLU|nr:hypothetical protein SPE_0472 [Spiroplasma eriocheiris CCTCC M 207170]AKM54057.1 hypothetical protein SERIO_v1c04780 [Spiroplasma eriocheiris]